MTLRPRGLLQPPANGHPFTLTLRAPAPRWAYFVEHYWSVAWDLRDRSSGPAGHPESQPGGAPQQVLSHPTLHLVREEGQARLYGVTSGTFSRQLTGAGSVFGVKFRPGGFAPLLGGPVAPLTDRVVALPELFGTRGAALATALVAATGDEAAIAVVEAFLAERDPPHDPEVARVNAIVAQIAADPALTGVAELARRCNIAPRTLQRLFRHYVGVGPKWVIQRYRLHEATDRLAAGAEERRLAQSLGYYDQAHFGNDFRAATGSSPAAYARRRQGSAQE